MKNIFLLSVLLFQSLATNINAQVSVFSCANEFNTSVDNTYVNLLQNMTIHRTCLETANGSTVSVPSLYTQNFLASQEITFHVFFLNIFHYLF